MAVIADGVTRDESEQIVDRAAQVLPYLAPSISDDFTTTFDAGPEGDLDPKLTARTVTGRLAADQAAALFDGNAGRLYELEDGPSAIVNELGFIGDPFMPWLEAVGLDWPEVRSELCPLGLCAVYSPAYECRPDTTRLIANRLNSSATNPATLIHAAAFRHPAVARACR